MFVGVHLGHGIGAGVGVGVGVGDTMNSVDDDLGVM